VRYRPTSSTPVVRVYSRGFSRIPRTRMACVLPFRPWLSPTLRVFKIRTARDQSTNPSLVLSCTSAPPQWLTLKFVTSCKKRGRPCLLPEAPRFTLRPFSISKPSRPFCRPAHARRLKDMAVSSKSAALRVWLPSRRFQPLSPREPFFSSPRSWALPFRALFRSRGPLMISQECSVLAFSCQTRQPGSDASTASAHETSCASGPRTSFTTPGGATALLGFRTFRVSFRRI
jgi:hypothetical protein